MAKFWSSEEKSLYEKAEAGLSFRDTPRHWGTVKRRENNAPDNVEILLDKGAVRVGDEYQPAPRPTVMKSADYFADRNLSDDVVYASRKLCSIRTLEEIALERGNGTPITASEFEKTEAESGLKAYRPDGFIQTSVITEEDSSSYYAEELLVGVRSWFTKEMSKDISETINQSIEEEKNDVYPSVKRVWSCCPEYRIVSTSHKAVLSSRKAISEGKSFDISKYPFDENTVYPANDREFYDLYKKLYIRDRNDIRWLLDCLDHKALILEEICINRGNGNEVTLSEAYNIYKTAGLKWPEEGPTVLADYLYTPSYFSWNNVRGKWDS